MNTMINTYLIITDNNGFCLKYPLHQDPPTLEGYTNCLQRHNITSTTPTQLLTILEGDDIFDYRLYRDHHIDVGISIELWEKQ